jgi:hypothetical protein
MGEPADSVEGTMIRKRDLGARLAVLAVIVLAVGCQGAKGDKGDKGDPGVQGPAGSNGSNAATANATGSCTGLADGVIVLDTTRKLYFGCLGGNAQLLGGQLYTGCKEMLAAAPSTPNGVYLLSPNGSPAHAVNVYCDMTTTRNGTLGWMLLANVNRDATFWAGWTKQDNIINTTRGTPSPASGTNYLLSIRDWQRFMSSSRTLLAEITLQASSYTLVYNAFRLSEAFTYVHDPGNVWQHNDPNNGVTYFGDLYPYLGSYAGNCANAASGGLGWWGACGYSQFYQPDPGGPTLMFHPTASNGTYVQVTGVTHKLYWMQ